MERKRKKRNPKKAKEEKNRRRTEALVKRSEGGTYRLPHCSRLLWWIGAAETWQLRLSSVVDSLMMLGRHRHARCGSFVFLTLFFVKFVGKGLVPWVINTIKNQPVLVLNCYQHSPFPKPIFFFNVNFSHFLRSLPTNTRAHPVFFPTQTALASPKT